MDYVQAVNYIKEIGKYGSVLGLDTIERLLERLGNPQEALKIVHFAGTHLLIVFCDRQDTAWENICRLPCLSTGR